MKTNMQVGFPLPHKCNLGAALMLVLLLATVAQAQLTPIGDSYTNPQIQLRAGSFNAEYVNGTRSEDD
jgi:hypothetical protein